MSKTIIKDGEILPNEKVLPDHHPIYGFYCYLVDGKPYVSEWHGITARQLRARLGAKEIRNCDIVERNLC